MEGLQGLDKLFFELASENRLGILQELQAEGLRMQELARRLSLTDTESSRQLQRLSEARLVQKQPDGKYGLTLYAKLVLDTASPLDFISRYREYFLDHDACFLPHEFRARLRELSGVRLISNTVETLNWVTQMFRDAQKKIYMTVVGFDVNDEIMRHRVQEGLEVRWLMDESFLPKARLILRSDKLLPQMRSIPKVPGHVAVTDKKALLTLPRIDGTLSYEAFVGEDASFLKWAEDLYIYRWERAKPWHP